MRVKKLTEKIFTVQITIRGGAMRNRKETVLMSGLTLALLGVGCDVDRTPDITAVPGSPTPAVTATAVPGANGANVSVADITSNWTNYDGQTVTVVADVEEVLGPRAFTLDEDSPLRGGVDNDLLVVSPQAGSLADIDDQWLNNKVRVTGVVRRFAAVDVEREVGWDLDPRIEAEYEGKRPVLIATSVERVQ
jgi:hypothetical protein